MPLTYLEVVATKVTDLRPLTGMKTLRSLYYGDSAVTDISPLASLALQQVFCTFNSERDTAILRAMKSLEFINSVPVDKFWKEIDEQQKGKKLGQ